MVIYALFTEKDGIKYIGQTKHTLEVRLKQHLCRNKPRLCNIPFSNWLLENKEDIEIIMLEICIDKEDANNKEYYWTQYYLDQGLELLNKKIGWHLNEEMKNNISIKNKGRQSRLGIKHTDEAKEKMSKSRIGKIPWNKGL